jgi:hypothetical protein
MDEKQSTDGSKLGFIVLLHGFQDGKRLWMDKRQLMESIDGWMKRGNLHGF